MSNFITFFNIDINSQKIKIILTNNTLKNIFKFLTKIFILNFKSLKLKY